MSEQTDKEAYDMGKHFKEEHDKLTGEIRLLKFKILQLKRCLMVSYGHMRSLDDIINGGMVSVPEDLTAFSYMVEIGRGFLSEAIDDHIFNLKKELMFELNLNLEENDEN